MSDSAPPLRCALLAALVMLCAATSAHADDVGELEAAATEVAAAHASSDAALLSKLAERSEPDPFLVAEVLCAKAARAAAAFAKAALGPDERQLGSYVLERTKTPPSQEDVKTLLDAFAERARNDWVALGKRAAGDDDTVLTVALGRWRADSLAATGETTKAIDAYFEAARRAREIGWLYAAAYCFHRAATAAHRMFRYSDKLEAIRERGAVERERGDAHEATAALADEGNTLTQLGRYSQALERLEEARAAYEKLDDRDGGASTLLGLASAHRQRGEHSKALALAEEGLALAPAAPWRAQLLTALGITRWAIGEHAKAIVAHERALAIVREFESPGWGAQIKVNIGIARSGTGDYQAAQEAYDEALDAFVKLNASVHIAMTLLNLADLENRRGRHEQALALCKRAQGVEGADEDPLVVALTEQNMAESLLGLGRFTDAVDGFKRHIAQAKRLEARKHLLEGHLGLAQCLLAQKKPQAALDAARIGIKQVAAMVGGLAEGQAAEARAQHARLFELGIEAATALDDTAAFAEILETGRAMALLESLEGREKLRSIAIPEAHRKEESEARAALVEARALHQGAFQAGLLREIKQRRKELEAATERLENVVKRIRRDAKARAALVYPTADDLDLLKGHLKAGEALVLYALTRGHYVALVIEKSARIVTLAKREDVEAACAAVVAATTDGSKAAKTALASLRKLVVDPLKLGSKTRRLLVSPTGDLFLVPLSALMSKHEITYVPSGTTFGLLRTGPTKPGTSVIAFGDVDYSAYPRLSALEASGAESRAIGDRVLLGKDATEGAVRTVLPERPRWKAVHFACHGILNLSRPMQSALALTKEAPDDGMLTVEEIFTARVPADLVTLSACESGRGRIYRAEGIIGLTRAFMYAGAPRVVCSLWKVDDDATKALMVEFYRLWKGGKKAKGISAAAALKQAQAFVASHKQWKHPYYWGAWVLWGLPE